MCGILHWNYSHRQYKQYHRLLEVLGDWFVRLNNYQQYMDHYRLVRLCLLMAYEILHWNYNHRQYKRYHRLLELLGDLFVRLNNYQQYMDHYPLVH